MFTSATSGTTDHPVLGPVGYTVEDIGWDQDGQVAITLGRMGQRVRQDSEDPGFRAWAYQVIGCQPGQCTDLDVVERAYRHVKESLRFQRDEVTGAGIGGYPSEEVVEVIIRPRELAKFVQMGVATGDCDDYTMYLACLLRVFGIPVEFCTVAADGRAPDSFSHVYVVGYPNGQRMALDASHGEYAGWEFPNVFNKRKQWPVNTVGALTDLVGPGLMVLGLYMIFNGGR